MLFEKHQTVTELATLLRKLPDFRFAEAEHLVGEQLGEWRDLHANDVNPLVDFRPLHMVRPVKATFVLRPKLGNTECLTYVHGLSLPATVVANLKHWKPKSSQWRLRLQLLDQFLVLFVVRVDFDCQNLNLHEPSNTPHKAGELVLALLELVEFLNRIKK